MATERIKTKVLGGSSQSNGSRKRNGIQDGKEVKVSACRDNLISYGENPMKPTKKLPELITKSSQGAGCKSNMPKSTAFLYPGDRQLGVEIKNNIYNCIKNMKYLGLNLTSDVYNLYAETHNTLLSETEEINSGERYAVFLGLKTHCGQDMNPRSDLHSPRNPNRKSQLECLKKSDSKIHAQM